MLLGVDVAVFAFRFGLGDCTVGADTRRPRELPVPAKFSEAPGNDLNPLHCECPRGGAIAGNTRSQFPAAFRRAFRTWLK